MLKSGKPTYEELLEALKSAVDDINTLQNSRWSECEADWAIEYYYIIARAES